MPVTQLTPAHLRPTWWLFWKNLCSAGTASGWLSFPDWGSNFDCWAQRYKSSILSNTGMISNPSSIEENCLVDCTQPKMRAESELLMREHHKDSLVQNSKTLGRLYSAWVKVANIAQHLKQTWSQMFQSNSNSNLIEVSLRILHIINCSVPYVQHGWKERDKGWLWAY